MDTTYQVFRIPKKSGGFRVIEAPNPELKATQKAILEQWQYKLPLSPYCHAFRKFHSIVSACSGHIGAPYMVRFDIHNFFPSIRKDRFERILRDELWYCARKGKTKYIYSRNYSEIWAYSDQVMKALEPCFHVFEHDEVQVPRLPQGAPTSPWLSNVFLTRFDYSMAFACKEAGERTGAPINYSRYADDVCISGSDEKLLWALYFRAVSSLKRLGLEINEKKTHMFKPHQRHMCVGLVVNARPQPKRRWRKNLRAEIHNQQVAGKPLKKSTIGKINFLEMCRKQESNIGSYIQITGRQEDLLD